MSRRSRAEKNSIDFFIHELLPKLSKTIDGRTLLVIGTTGSGKSTFINYMLGTEVISDAISVSLPSKAEGLPAISSSDTVSDTLGMAYYQSPESWLYCDTAGFGDTEKNLAHMQALEMAVIQHRIQNNHAIIILIPLRVFGATRGESFKLLLYDLITALKHSGVDKTNFSRTLLIINQQGDSRFNKEHITQKIKLFLTSIYEKLECIRVNIINFSLTVKNIDKKRGLLQTIHDIGREMIRHYLTPSEESNDASILDSLKNHETKLVEIQEFLEYILENGFMNWSCYDDGGAFRDEALMKLREFKTPVLKKDKPSYLLKEGEKQFFASLLKHAKVPQSLYKNHQKLVTLQKQKDNLDALVKDIDDIVDPHSSADEKYEIIPNPRTELLEIDSSIILCITAISKKKSDSHERYRLTQQLRGALEMFTDCVKQLDEIINLYENIYPDFIGSNPAAASCSLFSKQEKKPKESHDPGQPLTPHQG